MKAHLMHPERDFAPAAAPPANAPHLIADLELNALWGAMAAGDPFVFDVVASATLASLTDLGQIRYRQQALRDCIENPAVIRRLYDLTGEALAAERRVYRGIYRESPGQVLNTSVGKLTVLLGYLRELRALVDEHAGAFASPAFTRLFATLATELDDPYLDKLEATLAELRFPRGTLLSAQLGEGNKGERYVLHVASKRGWLERLGLGSRSKYSFTIPDRDVNGFRFLSELRDRGLAAVAVALARATDHVVAFFTMLCTETAFYVGCLNLHERLTAKGEPTCLPTPLEQGEHVIAGSGVYDPGLTLQLERRVVGNDIAAEGKSLVMITGANQGGKSTFLRGLGLAQLMMQCGMFVCAEEFTADVCEALFTHYKREEDATMTSGKLDEELARMSEIADAIRPRCMLLCNESFSSTNEREGSELARQVTRAMLDSGVKVVFVTHLFDLAHGFHLEQRPDALFVRAERRADGSRSFRLIEGEPLPTSYGADRYREIFGDTRESAPLRA